MIPPGIDLEAIRPVPPSNRPRPIVLHAPSSRQRKGTDHVIEACQGLDVELRIVEDLHHAEAFALFHDVDIVVDQLNAGWYGLFAIESMALGKPVVTFLHEQAVARTREAYGVDVPILNATKDTLRARLEELLEMGPEGRRVIGAASREIRRARPRRRAGHRPHARSLRDDRETAAAPPVARPVPTVCREPVDALDSVADHGRGGADRPHWVPSCAASAASPRSTGSAGSSRESSRSSCSRSTPTT